jgi:hypothetical protein
MIKVGDKVTIIGDSNVGPVGKIGVTGKVRRVDIADASATYHCETPYGDDDTISVWYPATSVKPLLLTDGWIENTTGKCPFKDTPNRLIDVRYRSGTELSGVKANAYFTGPDTSDSFWILDGMSCDIVAYRVPVEADGWIENTGEYPVAGDVALEVKFFKEDEVWQSSNKNSWFWGLENKDSGNIQYWRYKNPEDAPKAEPTVTAQVARLERQNAENEREMAEMREEITFLKGKLKSIRDLV